MSSFTLQEFSLLKPTHGKNVFKDAEALKDQWQTTVSKPGNALHITLKNHQLTITSGDVILESYFLLSSGVNMKAVCKKEALVVLYKTRNQTKIFKIKFEQKSGPCKQREFSKLIEKYFQVRYEYAENSDQGSTSNPHVKLSTYVCSLLNKNENKLPEIYRQNVSTTAKDLEGMVYLCVTDPNFAAFVGSVDLCLKKYQSN